MAVQFGTLLPAAEFPRPQTAPSGFLLSPPPCQSLFLSVKAVHTCRGRYRSAPFLLRERWKLSSIRLPSLTLLTAGCQKRQVFVLKERPSASSASITRVGRRPPLHVLDVSGLVLPPHWVPCTSQTIHSWLVPLSSPRRRSGSTCHPLSPQPFHPPKLAGAFPFLFGGSVPAHYPVHGYFPFLALLALCTCFGLHVPAAVANDAHQVPQMRPEWKMPLPRE